MSADDESAALNEMEPAEGKDDDLDDIPDQVSDSDSSSSDEEDEDNIPTPSRARGPCTGSSTRSHAGHPTDPEQILNCGHKKGSSFSFCSCAPDFTGSKPRQQLIGS